jgi:hypothetical protein
MPGGNSRLFAEGEDKNNVTWPHKFWRSLEVYEW